MLALLALASSAVWGTADFLGGLTARRLPAVAVVAWSQALALVALTAVLLGRGEVGLGPWLPWAVGAGVSGTSALVCFYAALSSGTMGVVSPIAALGVVVPVVVGVVAGERPGLLAWAGVVVAVAGAVLASGPELSGAAARRPVVLAVLAGLGFGVTLVLLDRGAADSVLHTLWGMRLTSVTGFAVAALAARRLGGVGGRDVPLLAVIGLADVLANGLYAYASSRGMVSLASVLGSLYPAVTVVLARLVLGERLARVQQAGVLGCLAGSVLIGLS